MATTERTLVFVSYSHQNKKWRERLWTGLKPQMRDGRINVWTDTRIKAGQEWYPEIEQAVAAAKVAVLLVSQPFFASDFIHQHELRPLLEAAKRGEVTILWIPISSVSAQSLQDSGLGQHQAVHNPQLPLSTLSYGEQEKALAKICDRIIEAFGCQVTSPVAERAAGGEPNIELLTSKMCDRQVPEHEFISVFHQRLAEHCGTPQIYLVHGNEGDALAADIVGLNYGFHMSLEFGKVGRLSQGVLTNSGPR